MKKITLLFGLFVALSLKARPQDIQISFNASNYYGSNISCHGASDGWLNIVVVGGASPYLFTWSNSSYDQNLSGLSAGVYTVIVTDDNFMTASATYTLSEPNSLRLTLSPSIYDGGFNISEKGGDNGSIDAEVTGGTGSYTYSWNNSETKAHIGTLIAGTYSVFVTDENNCTLSGSATLTEPSELHIVSLTSPTHNGYNISCYNGNNGVINLSVTGGVQPYDIEWSNGGNGLNDSNLIAGKYWVKIRDANASKIAGQIQLTQPDPLRIPVTPHLFANGKNISCYDFSDGSISSAVTGGVSSPPPGYLWSNGSTTSNIINLPAGIYSVVATDGNGCTAACDIITLTQPDRSDWTMLGNTGSNPATQFIGTIDSTDFVFRTHNTQRLKIAGNGNILFNGNLKIDNASTDSARTVFVDHDGFLRIGHPGAIHICQVPTSNWVSNACGNVDDIYNFPQSGRVGIGTMDMPTTSPGNDYQLYVKEGILTEKLVVALNGSGEWPDFVFSPDYQLKPILELEMFLNEEKHLPDIPTANELCDGVNILDLQRKELKMIEDLTLYIIELKKENIDLKKLISNK